MGLFDLFKSKTERELTIDVEVVKPPAPPKGPRIPSVSKDEKKYYQPDSYYKNYDASGNKVVRFDERKKISYPSHRGLWVAEILLLQYCSYGTYPRPKYGYPGFWWFEYGIRDVEKYLSSLEDRGFIRRCLPNESLSKLTAAELKDILKANGLPVSGKKQELVDRILGNVDFDHLTSIVEDPKYALTELGAQELEDNFYVPFIHKLKNNAEANALFGPDFNVWEVNLRLHERPGAVWQDILADMVPDGAVWRYEEELRKERSM